MILLPFIVIYAAFITLFFIALRSQPSLSNGEELKISIIVAAKNEAEHLSKLINALDNQNYSSENFEVIIVDDNSADSTYSLGMELIKDLPNFNIVKAKNKKYGGKRGALQIGIEKSNYDFLLFTDADCEPNEEFLVTFSNKFSSGSELVFGAAPIKQKDSILNKIICYDNLWVHILTFSLANLGLPYSAAGRSFGFRKEAFIKIEGYANTLETLSGDDDLLLREADKKGLDIGLIINETSFVYSESKENIKDFILQKARHTTTSMHYSNVVKIIIGTWHILNLFMIFSPLLIGVYPEFISLLFFKIIVDIFTVKSHMKIFGYRFSTIDILGLSIYHQFLLIAFFIGSIFRKKSW